MSNFCHRREVDPSPAGSASPCGATQDPRQTNAAALDSTDKRSPWQSLSPPSPFPHPCNGKAAPRSQLAMGTPQGHVERMSCWLTHGYQPTLLLLSLLPCLCIFWGPDRPPGRKAGSGGRASETGQGPGPVLERWTPKQEEGASRATGSTRQPKPRGGFRLGVPQRLRV